MNRLPLTSSSLGNTAPVQSSASPWRRAAVAWRCYDAHSLQAGYCHHRHHGSGAPGPATMPIPAHKASHQAETDPWRWGGHPTQGRLPGALTLCNAAGEAGVGREHRHLGSGGSARSSCHGSADALPTREMFCASGSTQGGRERDGDPPCHAGNCRLLILGPMLIALVEGGCLLQIQSRGNQGGRAGWCQTWRPLAKAASEIRSGVSSLSRFPSGSCRSQGNQIASPLQLPARAVACSVPHEGATLPQLSCPRPPARAPLGKPSRRQAYF